LRLCEAIKKTMIPYKMYGMDYDKNKIN
jgi:hypothetical protein